MVHGETEKMDGGGRNSNGSTRLELRLGVFLGFSNLRSYSTSLGKISLFASVFATS